MWCMNGLHEWLTEMPYFAVIYRIRSVSRFHFIWLCQRIFFFSLFLFLFWYFFSSFEWFHCEHNYLLHVIRFTISRSLFTILFSSTLFDVCLRFRLHRMCAFVVHLAKSINEAHENVISTNFYWAWIYRLSMSRCSMNRFRIFKSKFITNRSLDLLHTSKIPQRSKFISRSLITDFWNGFRSAMTL